MMILYMYSEMIATVKLSHISHNSHFGYVMHVPEICSLTIFPVFSTLLLSILIMPVL